MMDNSSALCQPLRDIANSNEFMQYLQARITALTSQERKQYQKLQKDLEECMEYHNRLHSVADQQIDFDLDDGVVIYYAKFGDVSTKLKYVFILWKF